MENARLIVHTYKWIPYQQDQLGFKLISKAHSLLFVVRSGSSFSKSSSPKPQESSLFQSSLLLSQCSRPSLPKNLLCSSRNPFFSQSSLPNQRISLRKNISNGLLPRHPPAAQVPPPAARRSSITARISPCHVSNSHSLLQFHYSDSQQPTRNQHVALWNCDTWQNKLHENRAPYGGLQ